VGPSDNVPLSPIIEEEEISRRLGKEHIETEEGPEEEKTVGKEGQNVQDVNVDSFHQAGHDSDDSHIFSNLSDVMITSLELFKDDTSQLFLSGAKITPSLPSPPHAKELTPTMKATTTPKSKSGSLHDACSLHFTHT